MFTMECGCYLNAKKFKLGRKYLYVLTAGAERVLVKRKLTDNLVDALKKIREQYRADDVNRTYKVLVLAGYIEEEEDED